MRVFVDSVTGKPGQAFLKRTDFGAHWLPKPVSGWGLGQISERNQGAVTCSDGFAPDTPHAPVIPQNNKIPVSIFGDFFQFYFIT